MWGPRLYLFVTEEDEKNFGRDIEGMLSENLPYNYKGFSTNYSDTDTEGISSMQPISEGAIRHLIFVTSLEGFVGRTLGPQWQGDLSTKGWLGALDQSLIELVAGEIYYDGLGTLNTMRSHLKFFPMDVARVRLAALWQGIAQEMAFVGRNRDTGDLLSVKMISSRLVNILMKMCFYLEKQYIPYSKWFGHGFKQLNCYEVMAPIFESVLTANDATQVECHLAKAYEQVLALQNLTDFTRAPVDAQVTDYYGRPYKVMFPERICRALLEPVKAPSLKSVKLDDVALLVTANGIDISNYSQWISGK
jgi:hypothetical protein